MTVVVGIEETHEGVSLGSGDFELDLTEARVELIGVNLVVAVEGVEVAEGSSETSDGLGTSGLDLLSHFFENCTQQERGHKYNRLVKHQTTLVALTFPSHVTPL